MEGLAESEEKITDTEVLGQLLDPEKSKFITNLIMNNIKGLSRLDYKLQRLANPKKDAVEIHNSVIKNYLIYLCSLKQKNIGIRSSQIVDAIKHKLQQDEQQEMLSMAQSLRK